MFLSLSLCLSSMSNFPIIIFPHTRPMLCRCCFSRFVNIHLFTILVFTGSWRKFFSGIFPFFFQSIQIITKHMFHLRTRTRPNNGFQSREYDCSNSEGEKLNIGKIEIVSHDKIKWERSETFSSVLHFSVLYTIWGCTVFLVDRAYSWVYTNPMQNISLKVFWKGWGSKREKAVKQNLSKKPAGKQS